MKQVALLTRILAVTLTFTAVTAVAAPLCHRAHAVQLSFNEISSRIDALVELRWRLQRNDFLNQAQFGQSLVYYDRETTSLSESFPDFKRLSQERYQELTEKLKTRHKARKSQEFEKDKNRTNKMEEVSVLNPHEAFRIAMTGAVKDAKYSSDGKWIFGLSRGQVLISDARTGKIKHPFLAPNPKTAPFNAATFSPDSKLLAIATSQKKILLVDVITGQTLREITLNENVLKVAFSPDSQLLLAIVATRHMSVIDVAAGKELYIIPATSSATFSPDSKWILVSFQGTDTDKQLLEARTGQLLRPLQNTNGGGVIKFSPDLKWILAGFKENVVQIIDAATGADLHSIRHQNIVYKGGFSPDSKWVATASYDKTAQIVDVSSGETVYTIEHSKWVKAVIWSHDSQFVATVSDDKFAFIVDVKTKSIRHQIPHEDSIDDAILNSDSTLLVTSEHNGLVRLIDVLTSDILGTVPHSRFISQMSFSPDERFLLTASDDNTLVVTRLYVGMEE